MNNYKAQSEVSIEHIGNVAAQARRIAEEIKSARKVLSWASCLSSAEMNNVDLGSTRLALAIWELEAAAMALESLDNGEAR